MTKQPVIPQTENQPTPLNEDAVDTTFVETIVSAKQTGPVFTPEEFEAWLAQR